MKPHPRQRHCNQRGTPRLCTTHQSSDAREADVPSRRQRCHLLRKFVRFPPDASVNRHRLLNALRGHWPEYMMEGAELGLYMLSACAIVVLLEYPTSPIHQALPDPALRRALMGVAMGLTAIGTIYSPLGQRSGAHFNPAVTLTFFRLGKIDFWDAVFYGAAQFIGGLLGVGLSALVLGELIAHPAVRYAVTVPGRSGVGVAFHAELVISFLRMSLVLRFANTPRLARF